jgi:hypothetical protein
MGRALSQDSNGRFLVLAVREISELDEGLSGKKQVHLKE